VRRTRWQRLRLGLLVGVPALVLGLLIAGEIGAGIAGCGSVDPTDPANYSVVTILNDTPGSVIVADCRGGYCHSDRVPVKLAPDQPFTDDAGCGASGAGMTSWLVTTAAGRVGYIAVHTPRKHDGVVFRVSQASPDRRTPTPPG
jgi:hypothetical protein